MLRRTNIVAVIWPLSSLTGGGRHQMPLHTLFEAQTGIRVEPAKFLMLASSHERIQSIRDSDEIGTHNGEEHVV
jgi:hypothetical protein